MATFRKRGDRWQAIVRRGGEQRSSTFGTKTAARAWASRIEAEIDNDKAFGRKVRETVADLFAEYERITRSRKPWGRSKAGSIKIIVRHLGEVRLSGLTRDRVVRFALDRQGEGAGPATVMMDISYLSSAVATMRDLKDWPVSLAPIEAARAALRRQGVASKSRERSRRPTGREIEALTDYFDTRSKLPMADMIRFAIASGMRLGEQCRIAWNDLDADRRLILIRDRKDPKQKQGNDQLVPLLGVAGFDALELIRRQPRNGPRIWPHRPETVSTIFPRACKALGIEDLHWHDFRREAASRMLEAGMPIQEVAIITGHREWRTLQRYARLSAEDVSIRWSPRDPAATERPSGEDIE